ncbi:type II toxin-antitoxin system RelE/ParE family toxin [Roseicyclus marinus]|uniref:type II toxin-antitoxin system RelE/ParE family toxin n=1 Tax=Roseicyclus marinus TaxID=2161673 RepID=UPI00240F7D56|nr:type II toxin-antitoxin system RelE/ParE family toxin [Roseicyclus marinus]MDG3042428.1 type II toxin-antitoxin system RelE/ParE family toxin [Roseicyclus marinus]
MAIRIQEAASLRLDEIYRYTRDRWGVEQADRYITDLFAAFDRIETSSILSRPIPADFGVTGFYVRHAQHVIYWRRLANGDIGIFTILHARMHQMDRFRDDLGA